MPNRWKQKTESWHFILRGSWKTFSAMICFWDFICIFIWLFFVKRGLACECESDQKKRIDLIIFDIVGDIFLFIKWMEEWESI